MVDHRQRRRDHLTIPCGAAAARIEINRALLDRALGHVLDQGVLPIVLDLVEVAIRLASLQIESNGLRERQDFLRSIEMTFVVASFSASDSQDSPGCTAVLSFDPIGVGVRTGNYMDDPVINADAQWWKELLQ
jgi:hypothetical protein